MVFSNARFLIVDLILVCCAVASPINLPKRGQDAVLGYIAVGADQAMRYNTAGTLTDDGISSSNSTQIGKGVYTFPNRDASASNSSEWLCIISADSDAVSRVSKAWIPQTYTNNQLWYATEFAINQYIISLSYSWDPSRTLRLSIIDGKSYGNVQLVIPPALLDSNGGGMDISASCTKDVNDLPDEIVDYDSWQYNIAGSRT